LGVTPNSADCLSRLAESPAALAMPITSALEACACTICDEKSPAPSACLALPTTVPPAALMASSKPARSALPPA
jgi:hypothetical protein